MTTWTPSQTQTHHLHRLSEQVFGQPLSRKQAYSEIEQGLEANVLKRFELLFPQSAQGVRTTLKISERTLTRRRQAGRFSPDESDRLYRLISLYLQAADVLESVEAADHWMTSPALALGNLTPLVCAQNEAGAKQIGDLLVRIDHGVYS